MYVEGRFVMFEYKNKAYYEEQENELFYLKQECDNLEEICFELEKQINKSNELKLVKIKLKNCKRIIEDKKNSILFQKLEEYNAYVLQNINENSYSSEFYDGISIAKTLDDFIDSQKEFLILKNQFYLSKNKKLVDLIIGYDVNDLSIKGNPPVMSDLKRLASKSTDWILRKDRAKRMKAFIVTLKDIDCKIEFADSKDKNVIYILNQPFQIGGQTLKNKMYYNNFGYLQDALYINTSSLMIIGVIVH